MLGPLYSYDETSKTSYITLWIGEKQKIYDLEVSSESNWTRGLTPGTAEFQEQKSKYEAFKDRCHHKEKVHPARSTRYEIEAYPLKEDCTIDYLSIEGTRQASNVSTLFRKELGDVFWTRVDLQTCAGTRDIWQLPPFLRERTAIHNSIKSLRVFLKFNHKSTPWDSADDFQVWCAYISETLKLETLQIDFGIDEEDLNQLSLSEQRFGRR